MEGLYHGKEGAGLVAMGVLHPSTADKSKFADQAYGFLFKVELPKLLSLMGHRNLNAFVPGINDIIEGGYTLQDGTTALSFEEKRVRGKKAIEALANFQVAKDEGRDDELAGFEATLKENFAYFGYGYLDKPEQTIPNVPLLFYTFRVMVMIGFYFILLFSIVWYFNRKKTLLKNRWILHVSFWSLPLVYISGQAGWIVAEVGRQPWTIQDLLPVQAAVSSVQTSSVITTFALFFIMFTVLLIAEVRIMVKQIKKGPEEDTDNKSAY